ncbi:division/outer membrane stress-associated lipid-binding lipoprotein [Alteromonas facilis]|uniref:division/outer membrane stress-associated lipid-binding lipoprotein n=1 Tax=Alteromonas facilis TaxID=2048004 RepID=UPI000C2841BE|nr:division/outer membrane stress-associated lipid-binding lipoprotein [Alteromonas facilis]
MGKIGKQVLLSGLIATALVIQSGCAVVAVGAAGTVAAVSANDRRTVGTQLDDTTLQGRIAFELAKQEALRNEANIQVNVYNSVVLLTGQAPSQALRQMAVDATQQVPNISKIHNQIRQTQPIGATTQANDIWLASKIRAKFVTDDRVPTLNVSVIVENSEVFLMGRLSMQEANAAVDIARNVEGVSKVVRAFDLKN